MLSRGVDFHINNFLGNGKYCRYIGQQVCKKDSRNHQKSVGQSWSNKFISTALYIHDYKLVWYLERMTQLWILLTLLAIISTCLPLNVEAFGRSGNNLLKMKQNHKRNVCYFLVQSRLHKMVLIFLQFYKYIQILQIFLTKIYLILSLYSRGGS